MTNTTKGNEKYLISIHLSVNNNKMYITKSNNANSLHSSSYNNIPILELNIGDYQIQKTIGEGAFSKVKLAIHKQTKQYVAIKIFAKNLELQAYIEV